MSHDTSSLKNGGTSLLVDRDKEGTPTTVGPDQPAAHAIGKVLLLGDRWLRHNEPGARRGDAEDVHRMRTTARRLRGNLALFRDLLAGEWAERLAIDLKWLGELLGKVRDADVMRERMRQSAGDLADDLGPLFMALAERHETGSAVLREAFEGDRYRDLLGQIARAADDASFADEAWEPCRTAVPPLVRKTWKRLRSAGRALDLDDPDEDYHEVRKRAKRARHGGETAASLLDPEASRGARRFVKRTYAVQNILGEHQDATIACREIRRIAAERPVEGAFNLAAGRLLEREEDAASKARKEFFKAWHKLDSPKNLRWMKG